MNEGMRYAGILLVAMFLSALATWGWIRYSKRESIGQEIREEGNKDHYRKQGTPTMGGVAFTGVFLLLLFVFSGLTPTSVLIALGTLGFSLVGFLDDMAKVRKKQSEGLTPRQKLILQFIFAAILLGVSYWFDSSIGMQKIPFLNFTLSLGILWIPILAFIMVGTVNAANLTDGLDGLCGGVSVPIFLTVAFLSMKTPGVATAGVLFAGVLLGFLFFNSNPAALFMGDTGSMAIGGGLVAMMMVMNRLPYLLTLAGLFLVEALSVMIQVAYFKRTGGKRIFLMSPIHHHFELKGYPEQKVAVSFILVSIVLSLLTILIW